MQNVSCFVGTEWWGEMGGLSWDSHLGCCAGARAATEAGELFTWSPSPHHHNLHHAPLELPSTYKQQLSK